MNNFERVAHFLGDRWAGVIEAIESCDLGPVKLISYPWYKQEVARVEKYRKRFRVFDSYGYMNEYETARDVAQHWYVKGPVDEKS